MPNDLFDGKPELENQNSGFFGETPVAVVVSSSFASDSLACFFSKAVSVVSPFPSASSSSVSDDSDPDIDSSSSPTALAN
jgi:hypothetical protein